MENQYLNLNSCSYWSHLSFGALGVLEANNLGIIQSELVSFLSTSSLYPTLAAGTIILGLLSSIALFGDSSEKLFRWSIRNAVALGVLMCGEEDDPELHTHQQIYKELETARRIIEDCTDNIMNTTKSLFLPAALLFCSNYCYNIGYFPLFCTTALIHGTLTAYQLNIINAFSSIKYEHTILLESLSARKTFCAVLENFRDAILSNGEQPQRIILQ